MGSFEETGLEGGIPPLRGKIPVRGKIPDFSPPHPQSGKNQVCDLRNNQVSPHCCKLDCFRHPILFITPILSFRQKLSKNCEQDLHVSIQCRISLWTDCLQ